MARASIVEKSDQGRNWSAPVVVTKDNEHPADLIVPKDGRVLMTFGQRNAPRGAQAMLSRDGGKTWQSKTVLGDDAPNTDSGYPSSIQLPDGRILTMYYQVDDKEDAPRSAKAKAVIWDAP